MHATPTTEISSRENNHVLGNRTFVERVGVYQTLEKKENWKVTPVYLQDETTSRASTHVALRFRREFGPCCRITTQARTVKRGWHRRQASPTVVKMPKISGISWPFRKQLRAPWAHVRARTASSQASPSFSNPRAAELESFPPHRLPELPPPATI